MVQEGTFSGEGGFRGTEAAEKSSRLTGSKCRAARTEDRSQAHGG